VTFGRRRVAQTVMTHNSKTSLLNNADYGGGGGGTAAAYGAPHAAAVVARPTTWIR